MVRMGSENMTADKLESFRRILQQKEDEMRVRLSATYAAEVVQRPEEPLDFGDWCQKSHEEWLFLNRNRLEVALFRDIQEALRRLEEGTYGICQGCNEPISGKRLDALPWAKFCVPCQERAALLSSGG